jgi:uncharacterized protein YidB (DUF937 family)
MYLPVALTTAEEADMGLLDVLNGMQNGPSGAPKPTSANTSSSGGMSPIMMALLGLLAFKAFKGLTGGSKPAAPAPTPAPPPTRPAGGTVTAGMPGSAAMPGNLNDLLKGGLGGLLAGGAAGSVLSGGLNDLLKQLQQSGHGETANSWVGTGPNRPISPKDLGSALGADQISALTSEYGLSRDELLDGLSEHLPGVVDHLTPGGKVPSAQEMQRLI